MPKNITTVKLTRETKERIDKLRVYHRQTYDEIMQDILNILNLCKVNPEGARIKLLSIDKKRKPAKKAAQIQEKKEELKQIKTLRPKLP